MTPQERQLVDDLFDRLSKVESAPRDPDAVAVINEGLRKAPNAVYALVQTVLLQDEALKRANARIQEMEAHGGPEQQQSVGFLDSMRDTIFGQGQPRGSVPNVPPREASSRPVWNSGQALQRGLAAALKTAGRRAINPAATWRATPVSTTSVHQGVAPTVRARDCSIPRRTMIAHRMMIRRRTITAPITTTRISIPTISAATATATTPDRVATRKRKRPPESGGRCYFTPQDQITTTFAPTLTRP